MSIIDNLIGVGIGINLMNGKIKPKKKGVFTYVSLIILLIVLIGFFIAFLYGLINLNIEFIFFPVLGIFGLGYILLISPYTQNSNNYYIKVQHNNSFEGFELYYKQKRIDLKYLTDNEGKFKWANNNAKLKCISYFDGTKMSNFTKYRIINYFSTWLNDNNYLSKDVTLTFEEL